MLKFAIIFSFNVVIMAFVTTLRETPETYVEWKIEKFFDLPTKNGYFLSSPKFSFANNKWFLNMFPYGTKSHGFISVYLCLKKTGYEGEHRIEYTLGSKTANDSTFVSFKTKHTFHNGNDTWGWSNFMNRSGIPSLMDSVFPKNTFTIFCKVRIVNSIEVMPEITSSNGLEILSENLRDLYISKRLKDVTLRVQNKEFSAHKDLLSCRLAAFGSMLENIPDTVEISDCDPESFNEFLLFVYTGKLVKVSSKKAMSLYLTARKYELTELKEECVRSIAEHDLNVDSFYEILKFANLHSDSLLLMSVTDFFIDNAKLIIVNEKWEKLLANDPLEANKLFVAYVEKKN